MSDTIQYWERILRNEDGSYDYAVSFDNGRTWEEGPMPEWARRYRGGSFRVVPHDKASPTTPDPTADVSAGRPPNQWP